MEKILQLQKLYYRLRMVKVSWQHCIDWAIERLQCDEEGEDLDVVMLAAATRQAEVEPLVVSIIERYIGLDALNDELVAGKYIVELHAAFQANKETASSLESVFLRMFYLLRQPTWLVMLARNCEYATDIENFEKPFEEEFLYISELWSRASSLNEFTALYDHEISNSHDVVRS